MLSYPCYFVGNVRSDVNKGEHYFLLRVKFRKKGGFQKKKVDFREKRWISENKGGFQKKKRWISGIKGGFPFYPCAVGSAFKTEIIKIA